MPSNNFQPSVIAFDVFGKLVKIEKYAPCIKTIEVALKAGTDTKNR